MKWIELILHAADSLLRSTMGMRPKFLLRRKMDVGPLTQPLSQSHPLIQETSKAYNREASRPSEGEIIKNRPLHLVDRYTVIQDHRLVDSEFLELRSLLLDDCDVFNRFARESGQGRLIHREVGVTAKGRAFAYFKPFNDSGWLMERSGPGWRISRAEKIVSQDMFLRSNGDPWDVVTVFSDPKGEGTTRVKSHRFGGALMSVSVYADRMKIAFGSELAGVA